MNPIVREGVSPTGWCISDLDVGNANLESNAMKRLQILTPTLFVGFLAATSGTGSLVPLCAEPPEIPAPPMVLVDDDPGVMMRAKLTKLKTVLDGLLRKDFASISRAARELKRISEVTQELHPRNDVYERIGTDFRRQCIQLHALASERDYEGVKSTYQKMTTTCIKCHEYVRDPRRLANLRSGDARPIPRR